MSLVDGLVAHWKLDETSGSRADSFGLNALTDVATVGTTTGKFGNAGAFLASASESFSITNPTEFEGYSRFSVNMWIRPTATGLSGERMLMSRWQHSVNNQFMLTIGATTIGAYMGHTTCNNFNYDSGSAVHGMSAGTWYMVTFVFNAGRMTYYVNAVNLGNSTHTATSIQNCAADFHIGARHAAIAGDWYDGDGDEMSFWKRALTDADVKALYRSGEGMTFPFYGGSFMDKIALRPAVFSPSRAR